ncbi:formate dehydrogenase subunit gamma [Phreatobacter stygius]|uniref:Formate dehydrogenase subunit gamma n=1 Tax=Phreatobacter stygius TaxID=1940610 RepID=A0A4D7BGV7_9HYPH|nr:formate dehydrogenase subunit gamma [Phreatobacter stygius]QCI67037.1 formate dehydrogenase subunit gamma [Phreatobacter stygius]
MGHYAAWDIEVARALITRLSSLDGAVMPILHALQDEFGYVDRAAVPLIADALNLSRAEVQGTISFYHDFRDEPAGRRVIKLCRAEACQAVGCENLVDHLRTRHGLAVDATTADGDLTIETVYCLGNCALGPAALVDGELVGRLDAQRLSALCEGRAVETAQIIERVPA